MASHDYGAMLDQFTLMARRHGIVNRVVQVPLHPRSDDEVVQAYAAAITPKTSSPSMMSVVVTGRLMNRAERFMVPPWLWRSRQDPTSHSRATHPRAGDARP